MSEKGSDIPTPEPQAAIPTPDGTRMQGRQILSYYVLLFAFLILTKTLLTELNARFDLAVFPTIAAAVQQALDNEAAFDSVINTIFSLLYAFLFSLPVAIVYRVTKEEERFDPALGQTIVLLAMVVTAVIVVIAGDLARAFGLAGVVAAVRFRNTLDDAKDAVYVFLAIAIGMACGAKAFTVALWTSIIMTASLYFMWRYQFGRQPGRLVAVRGAGKGAGKGKKGKKDKAGGKKPNAVLQIETTDLAAGQKHAEQELASMGGNWSLSGINASAGLGGTLNFVGRLGKKQEPSALIRAVLSDRSLLPHAEFRSLKSRHTVDALDLPAPQPLGREAETGPASIESGPRKKD